MTYYDKKRELDAQMIVMGLGYLTSFLVVIGWVATLVL
jgi:hypothetical protein